MDPTVSTISAVARVRAWRVANSMAPSRFAGLADVAEASLRGMDQPDWNPQLRTLQKLEALIPADWQVGDPVPANAEDDAAATTAAERAGASA